jgi:hypothetical protein
LSRVGSKSDPPEYVGLQLLDCLVQFNRLLPVGRGQFQDAPLGPSGQDAEEVPQVAKGLNAVHIVRFAWSHSRSNSKKTGGCHSVARVK